MTMPPVTRIFRPASRERSAAAKAVERGSLRRVIQGVYTDDVTTPLEILVRTRLHEVIAAARPGAVIADRSAMLGGKPTRDDLVFLVHDTASDVELPGGIVLRSRRGPGPLASDIHLPGEIHMSSDARAALENLVRSRSRGGRTPRTFSRAELEDWLDRRVSTGGETWASRLRDEAGTIAPALGLHVELADLDRLIGALLGTRTVVASSQALRARLRGEPYDSARVARFDELLRSLAQSAPPVPIPTDRSGRDAVLPFVEAYFSNFIEGTEFTFEEASSIVFDGVDPTARPADAHDIRGTYEIASDEIEMRRTPMSPADLREILTNRHATLMRGRPDKNPGQFKERDNRAGSMRFVAWRLVEGTLNAGFERYAQLHDPFARAAFLMFLVTETHPFDDGNGRVARLMMNAELVAADQARIVIPSVYRNNYVMALKGLSANGNVRSYIAMLEFAQRYTAQLDCSSLAVARSVLEQTHAFADPAEADARGIRLVLPTAVEPGSGQPEA